MNKTQSPFPQKAGSPVGGWDNQPFVGQPVYAVNESPAKKVLQEARPLCQGKLEELQGGRDIRGGFQQKEMGKRCIPGCGQGREVGKYTAFTGNRGTEECRGAERWTPGMMCESQIMKCL